MRMQIQRNIEDLKAAGFIGETSEHLLFVTYRGLRYLSESKISFPRDKHRLYFLKAYMNQRG